MPASASNWFSASRENFPFWVFASVTRLGEAFGGKVVRAPKLFHGKTSEIHHDGKNIFRELPDPFTATRYHSLIVERKSLPRELAITAETDDGIIMGLRHRRYKMEGVQFHPESVLTECGKQLLQNFLSL